MTTCILSNPTCRLCTLGPIYNKSYSRQANAKSRSTPTFSTIPRNYKAWFGNLHYWRKEQEPEVQEEEDFVTRRVSVPCHPCQEWVMIYPGGGTTINMVEFQDMAFAE